MPQVDPWEKAADCERALRITIDPIHRETLSNIREFWIALAQESRFLSEDALAAQIETIGRLHAKLDRDMHAWHLRQRRRRQPDQTRRSTKLISAARLGPRLACPAPE